MNSNNAKLTVDERIKAIQQEVQEAEKSGIIRLSKDYQDKVFLLQQVEDLADQLVELAQWAGQITQVAQGLQGNSERLRQEVERLREAMDQISEMNIDQDDAHRMRELAKYHIGKPNIYQTAGVQPKGGGTN